jgi:hypothetical protein
MILEFNRTKGGMDNADKLVREYSCARRTSRWSLRLFINMLDIAALNAFIIWMLKNKDWNQSKPNRRYRFLLELGKELTNPILRRAYNPNGLQFPVVRAIQAAGVCNARNPAAQAHYQHLGSSRAARGEDVYIVLEEMTGKSTQSAPNGSVLCVRNTGRSAQL